MQRRRSKVLRQRDRELACRFSLHFNQQWTGECKNKTGVLCLCKGFVKLTFTEVNADIIVWIDLKDFQGDRELLICVSVVWLALCQSTETLVS